MRKLLFIIALLFVSSLYFSPALAQNINDTFSGTSINRALWNEWNSTQCNTYENGRLYQNCTYGWMEMTANSTYLTSVSGNYSDFNMSVIYNQVSVGGSYYWDDSLSGFLFRAKNYTYGYPGFMGEGYLVQVSRKSCVHGCQTEVGILRYNNDGTYTILNSIYPYNVFLNTNYTLNVTAVGNTITIYWNNVFLMSAVDDTYSSGNISFATVFGDGGCCGYSSISNSWSDFQFYTLCTCGTWTSGSCFNTTHMTQTRSCVPSMCDIQTQYIPDASCQPLPTNPFFNKWMISTVVIIAISIGFAIYVGGDTLSIFLIVASVLFFMGAIIGLFPTWIIVLTILAVSLLMMKYILKLLGGGD